MTDAATLAQNRASEPLSSTWLSANAGSGKTKVLTDRVARLLLQGVAPQHILCLTYTKAAASEMQNRLFKLLGAWAMLPDDKLRDALAAIGEAGRTEAHLARARRLFAGAIEAPGGLKIQTIHSFCASLLRRFPLEADLSPAFTEMDERSARALRAEVLEDLAEQSDVVAQLAQVFTGQDIETLLAEICNKSALFDGPAPIAEDFGLPAGMDEQRLLAEVFLGSEADLIAQALPFLDAGGANDIKAAAKLRAVDLTRPNLGLLPKLEAVFLFGSGQKVNTARIDSFPNKDTRIAMGALIEPFNQFMARVEAARPLRLGLAALRRAQALHAFATPFLAEYRARKDARGWLDFDDLIIRTGQLLTDTSVAQWVLFKLEGGVDHILVDEAQDTSPAQWRVIELLTQEFTSGLGARDVARTLFVVGDKKQSIYSFQGADLRVFDKVQADFTERLTNVGLHLTQAALEHSFRSSDAVLRAVDMTFQTDAEGLGGPPTHIAFHEAMPGRVDLWPAILPDKPDDKTEWCEPVDTISDEHHTRKLAKTIAAELRRMIDARTLLPHKDGPKVMTEGDVLILVRKRSGPLFHEIITACKAAGLAIAGADRLRLGGEMAVRDLTALLAFLATPEDDLSLAACLRSPLFGWSEDALYRLAQGRAKGEYLWTRLRGQGDTPTLEILRDLRRQTDFLRPYDLIERMLTRHDGRRRLIARLGSEAEDGIDAFLAQALAYEQAEIPSLTGFLTWLERDEVELKRELDSASPMLRVMTVHGAKGLEAPIVILPDTGDTSSPDKDDVVDLAGRAAWKGKAGENPAPLQAALDARALRRAEESARLLYVAMTRAESWLIVAAAGEVKKPESWYLRVEAGLRLAGAERLDTPTGPDGLRHAHGAWPQQAKETPPKTPAPVALADALWHPAPPPPERPRPLRPSDLGGAKALPGEAGLDEEMALRLGTGLHLLLEHLPHWPRDTWTTRAPRLLAYPEDAERLLPEAAAVLDAPELAALFGPDSLAEVEIAGQIGARPLSGVIDRLVVTPEHVLAVDYKSNRMVPETVAEVPEGLLRQMGAYLVALEQAFPGRRVEMALLWTATTRLMRLPDADLRAALARAGA
ncbi:double-strand break repair helicase AddA [Roseibaca sp. Y0-43]|uniref:double-strand break repair helicase AddA n=1 Tax=Roseibaca sp. Y0-43 TaxID=2816854 RepID=UPI001D0C23A4|nr:double-strand break repair helicase AddA [Roseibaca sp. Y0-43]MCC1481326.1 double-strand break repair helicase AddA [Roseibaca sp. Y0-43]